MSDRIVAYFAERGVFLDPEAAAHMGRQANPPVYAERILAAFLEPPFHLTLNQVLDAEGLAVETPLPPLRSTPPMPTLPPARRPTLRAAPLAAEHASDVRVLRQISSDTAPVGETKDFVTYFNDRLSAIARLLRRRREVANAVPINRASVAGKEVQLIGMISDISRSNKAGHRFLELEDPTGTVTVLVHASRPDLVAMADSMLCDEVVGVVAKTGKDPSLLLAEALVRPDLPIQGSRTLAEVPLYAAFLGDVHLGSKTFLEANFRRMIRWLGGEVGTERERAIAQQVKYLVLPGDIVDGVGVYPGQNESLLIHDVLAQYRALAKEFEALPSHLSLVVVPGNHDASRPTEPQPALSAEIRNYFSSHETFFVSNPSTFSLHGVKVLAYHGYSMVDFTTHVPGQSLDRPLDIMKQMLQCRHLAPLFGGKTPISPEASDLLVIDPVPDLFVTGHVHVAGVGNYKGVSLVNGGTWQSQTSYQKMHNLTPTPALLPLVNLSNLSGTMIDFSSSS